METTEPAGVASRALAIFEIVETILIQCIDVPIRFSDINSDQEQESESARLHYLSQKAQDLESEVGVRL